MSVFLVPLMTMAFYPLGTLSDQLSDTMQCVKRSFTLYRSRYNQLNSTLNKLISDIRKLISLHTLMGPPINSLCNGLQYILAQFRDVIRVVFLCDPHALLVC